MPTGIWSSRWRSGPTGIWSSQWRSGSAHWDLDCEEEAAGEEAEVEAEEAEEEEENSSDKIYLLMLTGCPKCPVFAFLKA